MTHAVAVADQVVFGARLAAVDRRRGSVPGAPVSRRSDCRPSPRGTSRSGSPRSNGSAAAGPTRCPCSPERRTRFCCGLDLDTQILAGQMHLSSITLDEPNSPLNGGGQLSVNKDFQRPLAPHGAARRREEFPSLCTRGVARTASTRGIHPTSSRPGLQRVRASPGL